MSILELFKPMESFEDFRADRLFAWIRTHENPVPGRCFENLRQELFTVLDPQTAGMGITRVAQVRFHGRSHVGDNGINGMTRFACVTAGEAWFRTPSGSWHLKPGMFFSRLTLEENTLRVPGPESFHITVVCCTGAFSHVLHRQRLGQNSVAFLPQHPDRVLAAFEQILDEAREQSEQSQHIAACQMEILLRRITPHASADASSPHSRAYATFRRCRQHITRHALELGSAQEMARACHIDASYLGRLFQRFEHLSPYQYLMRIKMNYAGELLLNSADSIQEIANQIGFSDAFVFSRAFKRIQGRPPREYRRDR